MYLQATSAGAPALRPCSSTLSSALDLATGSILTAAALVAAAMTGVSCAVLLSFEVTGLLRVASGVKHSCHLNQFPLTLLPLPGTLMGATASTSARQRTSA